MEFGLSGHKMSDMRAMGRWNGRAVAGNVITLAFDGAKVKNPRGIVCPRTICFVRSR